MKTNIKDFFGWGRETKGEVGLEIEMEGSGLQVDVSNNWSLHQDGSLRPQDDPDKAIEYVLNKPVPRKQVGEVLSELDYAWAKNGSKIKPSNRCGVHVHINCQTLSIMQVFNFASLYYLLEEPLVKWCGDDREGNLFCLRLKDADYQLELIKESFLNDTLSHTLINNHYRYASMNLSSLRKFGSVEFRALRTPNSVDIIKTWVDILLAIKDASLQFDHPKDLVSSLSQHGPAEFLRQTLGDMGEIIRCKNISNMLMDGVRRVQEYAYAVDVVPKPVPKSNKLVQGGDWATTAFNTLVFDEAINTTTIPQAWIQAGRGAPTPPPLREPTEEENMEYRNLLNARTRAAARFNSPDYTEQDLENYRIADREYLMFFTRLRELGADCTRLAPITAQRQR